MIMKYFNVARLFLVFMMLLGNTYAFADDLFTDQIVINVKQAGTLPDRIGNNKKYKITNLKLIGELNGTDFNFIREMVGAPSGEFESKGKGGNLKKIDLEEARIVSGGSGNCYTKDNTIGNSLFYGCKGIESFMLPSGVTSIGKDAFAECYSLSTLSIPSCVSSIESGEFYGCRSLLKVDIPSGVTSLGDSVFKDCSSLTEVTIPSSVTRIPYEAFHNCSSLTNIVIPSSVTWIGGWAFEGCSSLTNLVIPSSVTYMGDYSFRYCSALTSLVITSSVTNIGYYAFDGCDQLTDISYYIYDSLEDYLKKGRPDLNKGLHRGVSNSKIKYYIDGKEIVSLEIPKGVTTIGNLAFCNSRALMNLTIPEGVASIGYSAFEGCEGLTSLRLPSSVTSLGSSAFYGCTGLTSIYAYMLEPKSLYSSVFYGVDKQKCILNVPQDAYQDYWLADGWGDFENIVGFDVTGIENKLYSNKITKRKSFSLNGQCLTAPTKGLNIVKYSDGSVRKEMVK